TLKSTEARPPSASSSNSEVTFVSELSSKPAQKLSKYGWYGNVRLQRFHVPEETAIARWLFSITKGHSFHCGQHNVTIHIRWGAPPVINPTGSVFPNATLWSPSLSLTLPVTSHSSTTFNLSDPNPGDWYIAAHLPEDDGRIEQKGFPSCSYFFQPQLAIRRAVDTPILEQGTSVHQTAAPDRPARLKLYIPEFASSLSVSVTDCSSGGKAVGGNCWLVLRLGSASLQHKPVTVNCSGTGCSATLSNPPWDTWLRVVVESSQDNHTVTFSIFSNYTGEHRNRSLKYKVYTSYLCSNSSHVSFSNYISADNSSVVNGTVALSNKSESAVPLLSASACVWSVPVLYEEVDVLSLRFTPVNGPSVSVTNTHPTLLTYPLYTQASGGTLNLQLTFNTVSTTMYSNLEFDICLVYWFLYDCHFCSSDCGNASVVPVVPDVFISACVEDCGTYGECRLLRSYSYLYASCVCKAGWSGWGCTDDRTAQSYSRQMTATLLLTLSNLFFLPAVVVAIRRCYITEASVYLFTMFFSTFYHACDQPGIAVLCIMDYDTLQYCDFLGSVCSIWVTILCMTRIKDTFKYTVFMLGALLIAMSMQLDRKGLWNLLGPVLCALLFMVTAWVYRGVQRRHCYPPSCRRWVFYLLPGAMCALIGVCLYIFAETEENYYYIHSLWHILVASCVVFLWSWRPRVCGYTLCQNGKDELYTVT
uniref:EGF-like domain-containing protein n=1 Tax=Monopterus albus TaxID=43700 RepID=A0A3Q3IS86_MONAL